MLLTFKKAFFIFMFCISVHLLFALKPIKEYIIAPNELKLKYTEEEFVTVDSFNIKSWHILPSEINRKNISIIISYGDFGKMSYWLNHAQVLASSGYDIWLYDYRGFGASSNFIIDPNQLYYNQFKKDLQAVINGVRLKTDNKICLLGLSMGSIINILYLHESKVVVNFLIGDGAVIFPDLVPERLLKPIILPEIEFYFQDFYKKDVTPFLLFHGSNDVITTQKDLEYLKKYKKNFKVTNYKGNHLQSFLAIGDQYIQNINEFLYKN